MTEYDISKVLIEGDTATIMGVKYKRVEESQSFTEREGQLHFVISEWWDQVFTSGDSKDESISTLVEYIMELEDEDDSL